VSVCTCITAITTTTTTTTTTTNNNNNNNNNIVRAKYSQGLKINHSDKTHGAAVVVYRESRPSPIFSRVRTCQERGLGNGRACNRADS